MHHAYGFLRAIQYNLGVTVSRLLNVPATCNTVWAGPFLGCLMSHQHTKCISWMDLLTQLHVLPHCGRNSNICRSAGGGHPDPNRLLTAAMVDRVGWRKRATGVD